MQDRTRRTGELTREAAARGDMIEAENLYQHAEHYFRQMRETSI
jgi:hypothetical protein